MMGGGTFPLRKPGMVTSSAMWPYAWAMLGRRSSGGTEMASRTRVGLSFSTVVQTTVVLPRIVLVDGVGEPRPAVGATGFEPAASRSQSGCSTKLSYAPVRARPVAVGAPAPGDRPRV